MGTSGGRGSDPAAGAGDCWVLEFAGAVLFGHAVSETLATEIVDPALFVTTPVVVDWGFSAVGLWSVVANCHGAGWWVSSSHAVWARLAG